jgi:site-specific DNA recombinase
MKAVMYARYNQQGGSADSQLSAIRDFANEQKVTIVKEYVDEACSANMNHRPQFIQMIDDITSGKIMVDFCYIHRLDRFARNAYDFTAYHNKLQVKGVKLIAVAQPSDNFFESPLLKDIFEAVTASINKE